MRGKLVLMLGRRSVIRIIPAHAGQTQKRFVAAVDQADHPRACGANVRYGVTSAAASGSSPRMRGKHEERPRRGCCGRIIPAHAGQTIARASDNAGPPDHPRACGANDIIDRMLSKTDGSSPRMRGKPVMVVFLLYRTWIIPAHAGQTSRTTGTTGSHADHPRACGANLRAQSVTK